MMKRVTSILKIDHKGLKMEVFSNGDFTVDYDSCSIDETNPEELSAIADILKDLVEEHMKQLTYIEAIRLTIENTIAEWLGESQCSGETYTIPENPNNHYDSRYTYCHCKECDIPTDSYCIHTIGEDFYLRCYRCQAEETRLYV